MLKLEVGKFYICANGEVVRINKLSDMDSSKWLWGNNGKSYLFNGKYREKEECEHDLIAEIPKELHQHLIKEVMNYWQDEDFRKTVNNVYGSEK